MKTIYSLVTKPINQNVAIIRISGEQAFDVIQKMIPNFIIEHGSAKYVKLMDKDEYIDDVLILSFVSPNSFTGENVIEIQCHGSMFIVKKICNLLTREGIEQSVAGEFSKQAFMNGKIDLAQASAINSLILSENEELTNRSSQALDKKQSTYINNVIEQLGKVISRIQVAIDYPENTDLPEFNIKNIGEEVVNIEKELSSIIKDSTTLQKYSQGIVVSIIGRPNAGKSTLLNTLSKSEKAIVTDIKGTTRDIIESTVYFDGLKVTFQDTAGLNKDSQDVIENIGIEKAKQSVIDADIVIHLLTPEIDINEQLSDLAELNNEIKDKLITICNKSDSDKTTCSEFESISAINNELEPLNNKLRDMINNSLFKDNKWKERDVLLITSTQIELLKQANQSLANVEELINANSTEDVIAIELENAMNILGKIIGKEIDQDYITNLFSSFCIGK